MNRRDIRAKSFIKSFRETLPQINQRLVMVQGYYSGSESPSDDEIETDKRNITTFISHTDGFSVQTREFWYIAKAVKFLRYSYPSTCLSVLNYISECDFNNVMNLKALLTENGLETLVNLTEVNHPEVVIAALAVLKNITVNIKLIRSLIDLGICANLVKCLTKMRHELVTLSCEVIANIGRVREGARNIRHCDGVRKIVSLLDINKHILLVHESSLSEAERDEIHISNCAARALWSLSKFTKTKRELQNAGVIPIMTQLILSGNSKVSLPMTGMLCECSSEYMFQLAIESDGLVGVLLKDMMSDDKHLNYLCANALANAVSLDEFVSHSIRRNGGLKSVITLLKSSNRYNVPLIACLLKLLWRSAAVKQNVKKYDALGAAELIVQFIDSNVTRIRVPATGAVSQLAKYIPCREKLTDLNVIDTLITNFGSPEPKLICNTAHAIGELVKSKKAMKIVQDSDVVRLMWSLLKNKSVDVQVEALDSLLPIVQKATDPAELVRSLDGSLHLLVNLLRHGDVRLIKGACLLVAQIARDKENLMVMTDHGLLKVLACIAIKEGEILREMMKKMNSRDVRDIIKQYGNRYTTVDDDPEGVRQALASAIAQCSTTQENALVFGISGVISTLVLFLKSKKSALREAASHALWELSRIELNCIQIHLCGAVTRLLQIVGQQDQLAQVSAAGVLANMRRVLVANDQRCYCVYPNSPRIERPEIPVK